MALGPDNFLIWGGGGHGKVVADLVRAAGHRLVGYIDADNMKLGQMVEPGGGRVILAEGDLLQHLPGHSRYPESADGIALGIGNSRDRMRCLAALDGRHTPPLVHPSAVLSPSVVLGRGTVVFAAAVIQAAATIGEGVIVNTGAIIEHDCHVGDGAHISPGAILAGGVSVGDGSWVGAGATVMPGVRIGAGAMIGAGAVVLRAVANGITVVGIPARPVGG